MYAHRHMRLTRIVCTLGPACTKDKSILLALAKRGMSVARLNFSHGSQEQHVETIKLIRQINKKHGFFIPVLLDTKGCEIRTGDVKEPIMVAKGQEVVFSPNPIPNEKRPVIHVNYDGFAADVAETDRIILDGDSMTSLESRVARLAPATVYSRLLVARQRAA